MRRLLLIMAKRPVPGYAKTRLCPPLTPVIAAELYSCFLRDMIRLVRSLPGITPGLAFSPKGEEVFFEEMAPDFVLLPQGEGPLGKRLSRVLKMGLDLGYEQVAAVNSDSPTLPQGPIQPLSMACLTKNPAPTNRARAPAQVIHRLPT